MWQRVASSFNVNKTRIFVLFIEISDGKLVRPHVTQSFSLYSLYTTWLENAFSVFTNESN
jgi:hypothetical protein